MLKDNTTIPELELNKLAPELCHGLSREDCLKLDDSFTNYTRRTRNLIQTTGAVKTLVLCVRFTDHMDRILPTKTEIEALWNAREGEDLETVPTGSISEFLRRNSYENMQLDADVTDWIVTDNTELYYSFDQSGLTRELADAMYPVLRQIDALGIDFSQYDRDGDGIIDSLVLLHSGHPAEIGGLECVTNRPATSRIWSHAIGSFDNKWTSFDGQYSLGGYMVASAVRGVCGGDIARIGVMTHEFIHTWGVPDLYDTSGEWIGRGIGSFDLMSNPYGLVLSQTHPNNMSPWCKMQSGWLEPIEITQDGEYIIEASALSPSVFIIRDKFPDDEYILIENRQPIGWDTYLWGGGLLIWHIDDNANKNSQRGYPGMFGWPGNGNHYQVAVVQGDRNYDLEKGNNNGDMWDFWTAGQELSPGPFEYEATDYSQYPNTNSYMFGSIWPTGIRIYDISESDTVMTFKVQGLSPAEPPTPNPSWSPTPPPTRLPTWSPSDLPTKKPTPVPSTQVPTVASSGTPSGIPTTVAPTSLPPSAAPSQRPSFPPPPTDAPVTPAPVTSPVTPLPTKEPTESPSVPPTESPSESPTDTPTLEPTADFVFPSMEPTPSAATTTSLFTAAITISLLVCLAL